MAKADLGDIGKLVGEDSDVASLVDMLRKVLGKYGAFRTMRIVACVLAPYKRRRFEEKLEVKESRTWKYAGFPCDLIGKEIDIDLSRKDMGLDHTVLWQQKGKLLYLTSESYYVSKKELANLIEHCNQYGIDFQIDAESCYYPGHAIRILFKKDYVSQYDAMQQLTGEIF